MIGRLVLYVLFCKCMKITHLAHPTLYMCYMDFYIVLEAPEEIENKIFQVSSKGK